MKVKYKRISLKLSGEALGSINDSIDFEAVDGIAKQIAALHELGVQVGVTLGGGNIWRGRNAGAMDRNRADHMGMLATVINSLSMQEALIKLNVPCVVMSAVDMPRIAESYTSRAALCALCAGKVVIFAGGTGSPFFSTDTAAALKAAETHAQALMLAKNVDAVYSGDPKVDPDAKRYAYLTYDEVIEKKLHATDLTAITLCREQNIPICVFSMRESENIVRAVCGERVGTLIGQEPPVA